MSVPVPAAARRAEGLRADLATRRAGFTPGLRLEPGGRARAVASVWAGQLAALEERVNLAPDKHGLALLDLVGVDLLAAQPARVIVVLEAVAKSIGGRAPAGARVGAQLPGLDAPLAFEIERAIAVPDARLVEVVSVDPGSGTSADHSAALASGAPFTLFAPATVIAHELYLGHDALLALAGRTTVDIDVALRVTAGAPLVLEASWWDGDGWRPFAPFADAGSAGDEDSVDGTNGLTTSGTMRLFTPCGAARRLAVRGIETHWLRVRIARPLAGRPAVRLPEVGRLLLRSVVQRRRVAQSVAVQSSGPPELTVALWDAEGKPLPDRTITIADRLGGTAAQTSQKTAETTVGGRTIATTTFPVSAGQSYALAVEEHPEAEDFLDPIDGASATVRVDLALQRGLLPDAAVGDGRPLDLTKAFLPLGPGPTSGAALYLACDEPFARPEADVAIELTRARTAQEEAAELGSAYEVTVQAAQKALAGLLASITTTTNDLAALASSTGDLGRATPDLVAWWNTAGATIDGVRAQLRAVAITDLMLVLTTAYWIVYNPLNADWLREQIDRAVAAPLNDVANAMRLLTLDTVALDDAVTELLAAMANTDPDNAARQKRLHNAIIATLVETANASLDPKHLLAGDIAGPGGGPPATVLADVTARIGRALAALTAAMTGVRGIGDALRNFSPEVLLAGITKGKTPPDLASARLAWEYFDGSRWRTLIAPSDEPVPNLGASGRLRFRVPTDWAPSAVAGDTRRWLRARLDSGSYAHLRLVSWTDPKSNTVNYLPVIEPRPPLLSGIEVFYRAASRTVPPQRCLTLNDDQWREEPAAADVPGPGWVPFRRAGDGGPTLYLGFDAPLPADRIGLYADIVPDPSMLALAPVWEAWDGEAWRRVAVDDGTQALRTAGVVQVSFPGVPRAGAPLLARFGTARSWLRLRFDPQADPPPLAFAALSAHATTVLQVETVRDEVIGSSDGTPHQVLFFSRRPVLEGEAIAVRELEGRRAEVELQLLRAELVAAGIATEPLVLPDPVSERPQEVWVTWQWRPSLAFSGPADRHYTVDRAGGRVLFGDGRHGRIPPAAPDGVRAAWYRTGGGAQGNVPAGTITSVLSGIGAASVTNPRPGEGAADAEPMGAVARRGSAMLRHRRQALTTADYEALAAEASPAVARARARGAVDTAGRSVPGVVRLAIVPFGREPEPQPSDGLRRRVSDFVAARAPASLAGALYVTGPRYRPVGVDATVRPFVADDAGPVRDAVLAALEVFLHPLAGGPVGDGWTFGRGPFLSDVAAVLEAVFGVDALTALAFVVDGAPSGERVDVAPDRLVCAGLLRVSVAGAER